jgi:hypothetical protein
MTNIVWHSSFDPPTQNTIAITVYLQNTITITVYFLRQCGSILRPCSSSANMGSRRMLEWVGSQIFGQGVGLEN